MPRMKRLSAATKAARERCRAKRQKHWRMSAVACVDSLPTSNNFRSGTCFCTIILKNKHFVCYSFHNACRGGSVG